MEALNFVAIYFREIICLISRFTLAKLNRFTVLHSDTYELRHDKTNKVTVRPVVDKPRFYCYAYFSIILLTILTYF